MILTSSDIIECVKNWQNNNGISEEVKLNDQQIGKFISELQKKISKMNYSVPEGTTVIAYSGLSNGEDAWKIVQKVSGSAGDDAVYISDLPAGKLLNNKDFTNALKTIVGEKIHLK